MRCELGKSRRGIKEYTREQRLSKENKQLKRELGQLRKILARMDLDRYDSIKEALDEHNPESEQEFGAGFLESLKKTWACKECTDGFLEIFVYNKLGSPWYYRSCSNAPIC